MTTRNYAIEKVEIAWAPPGLSIDLKEGIAEGTSIQEAKAAPRYSTKLSGTGSVVRVRNPSRNGELTITVDQESATHQRLWERMLADDLAGNVIGPIVMSDLSSGEVFNYVNSYIMNEPDESRGVESATFPWVFGYERKVKIPGGGDENVIGD